MLAENRQQNLQELYMTYSDDLYRYIYYMVRDATLAEDLVQETFIRAYRRMDTFRHESNIRTWLYTVARNATIDQLRKRSILSWIPLIHQRNIASDQPLPEELILKDERTRELYQALGQLKQNYREVLILRKIEELSTQETADILGWSEAKVKSTLLRALQALKETITRGDTDELARSIQ